jgi:hypothetical protein
MLLGAPPHPREIVRALTRDSPTKKLAGQQRSQKEKPTFSNIRVSCTILLDRKQLRFFSQRKRKTKNKAEKKRRHKRNIQSKKTKEIRKILKNVEK